MISFLRKREKSSETPNQGKASKKNMNTDPSSKQKREKRKKTVAAVEVHTSKEQLNGCKQNPKQTREGRQKPEKILRSIFPKREKSKNEGLYSSLQNVFIPEKKQTSSRQHPSSPSPNKKHTSVRRQNLLTLIANNKEMRSINETERQTLRGKSINKRRGISSSRNSKPKQAKVENTQSIETTDGIRNAIQELPCLSGENASNTTEDDSFVTATDIGLDILDFRNLQVSGFSASVSNDKTRSEATRDLNMLRLDSDQESATQQSSLNQLQIDSTESSKLNRNACNVKNDSSEFNETKLESENGAPQTEKNRKMLASVSSMFKENEFCPTMTQFKFDQNARDSHICESQTKKNEPESGKDASHYSRDDCDHDYSPAHFNKSKCEPGGNESQSDQNQRIIENANAHRNQNECSPENFKSHFEHDEPAEGNGEQLSIGNKENQFANGCITRLSKSYHKRQVPSPVNPKFDVDFARYKLQESVLSKIKITQSKHLLDFLKGNNLPSDLGARKRLMTDTIERIASTDPPCSKCRSSRFDLSSHQFLCLCRSHVIHKPPRKEGIQKLDGWNAHEITDQETPVLQTTKSEEQRLTYDETVPSRKVSCGGPKINQDLEVTNNQDPKLTTVQKIRESGKENCTSTGSVETLKPCINKERFKTENSLETTVETAHSRKILCDGLKFGQDLKAENNQDPKLVNVQKITEFGKGNCRSTESVGMFEPSIKKERTNTESSSETTSIINFQCQDLPDELIKSDYAYENSTVKDLTPGCLAALSHDDFSKKFEGKVDHLSGSCATRAISSQPLELRDKSLLKTACFENPTVQKTTATMVTESLILQDATSKSSTPPYVSKNNRSSFDVQLNAEIEGNSASKKSRNSIHDFSKLPKDSVELDSSNLGESITPASNDSEKTSSYIVVYADKNFSHSPQTFVEKALKMKNNYFAKNLDQDSQDTFLNEIRELCEEILEVKMQSLNKRALSDASSLTNFSEKYSCDSSGASTSESRKSQNSKESNYSNESEESHMSDYSQSSEDPQKSQAKDAYQANCADQTKNESEVFQRIKKSAISVRSKSTSDSERSGSTYQKKCVNFQRPDCAATVSENSIQKYLISETKTGKEDQSGKNTCSNVNCEVRNEEQVIFAPANIERLLAGNPHIPECDSELQREPTVERNDSLSEDILDSKKKAPNYQAKEVKKNLSYDHWVTTRKGRKFQENVLKERFPVTSTEDEEQTQPKTTLESSSFHCKEKLKNIKQTRNHQANELEKNSSYDHWVAVRKVRKNQQTFLNERMCACKFEDSAVSDNSRKTCDCNGTMFDSLETQTCDSSPKPNTSSDCKSTENYSSKQAVLIEQPGTPKREKMPDLITKDETDGAKMFQLRLKVGVKKPNFENANDSEIKTAICEIQDRQRRKDLSDFTDYGNKMHDLKRSSSLANTLSSSSKFDTNDTINMGSEECNQLTINYTSVELPSTKEEKISYSLNYDGFGDKNLAYSRNMLHSDKHLKFNAEPRLNFLGTQMVNQRDSNQSILNTTEGVLKIPALHNHKQNVTVLFEEVLPLQNKQRLLNFTPFQNYKNFERKHSQTPNVINYGTQNLSNAFKAKYKLPSFADFAQSPCRLQLISPSPKHQDVSKNSARLSFQPTSNHTDAKHDSSKTVSPKPFKGKHCPQLPNTSQDSSTQEDDLNKQFQEHSAQFLRSLEPCINETHELETYVNNPLKLQDTKIRETWPFYTFLTEYQGLDETRNAWIKQPNLCKEPLNVRKKQWKENTPHDKPTNILENFRDITYDGMERKREFRNDLGPYDNLPVNYNKRKRFAGSSVSSHDESYLGGSVNDPPDDSTFNSKDSDLIRFCETLNLKTIESENDCELCNADSSNLIIQNVNDLELQIPFNTNIFTQKSEDTCVACEVAKLKEGKETKVPAGICNTPEKKIKKRLDSKHSVHFEPNSSVSQKECSSVNPVQSCTSFIYCQTRYKDHPKRFPKNVRSEPSTFLPGANDILKTRGYFEKNVDVTNEKGLYKFPNLGREQPAMTVKHSFSCCPSLDRANKPRHEEIVTEGRKEKDDGSKNLIVLPLTGCRANVFIDEPGMYQLHLMLPETEIKPIKEHASLKTTTQLY